MSKFVKKCIAVLSPAFSMLFLFIGVQAQTFSGAGFTIVDGGNRTAASCSTVAVSGITNNSVVNSVTLTNMNHTWLGDTEIRVYRPNSVTPPSTAAPSVVLASPPDGRSCNYAGTYRFIDTASTSIDAATVGCSDATNIAAGDYRSSSYGGGTNPGPVTSVSSSFGALTPAQINGNWLVCVFDFVAQDGGTVGGTSINFLTVLAGGANVGGRAATPSGRGVSGAQVTLVNSAGVEKTAISSPLGYFQFEDVQTGETYILKVKHKRYEFENPTQVISVNDNLNELEFKTLND